jgi:hypothetical protein
VLLEHIESLSTRTQFRGHFSVDCAKKGSAIALVTYLHIVNGGRREKQNVCLVTDAAAAIQKPKSAGGALLRDDQKHLQTTKINKTEKSTAHHEERRYYHTKPACDPQVGPEGIY